jgi:hypothetical protein
MKLVCVYEQDPTLFLCEPDLEGPLSLQQFLDLVYSARHNDAQNHATFPTPIYYSKMSQARSNAVIYTCKRTYTKYLILLLAYLPYLGKIK